MSTATFRVGDRVKVLRQQIWGRVLHVHTRKIIIERINVRTGQEYGEQLQFPPLELRRFPDFTMEDFNFHHEPAKACE